MNYSMGFVESLKQHPNSKQILQVALEVILQEKNYSDELAQYKDSLSRDDKILVSKCTKVLKEFAIRPRTEVTQTLERIAKVDSDIAEYLKSQILPSIQFDRKLNNYCFIKYYTDRENSSAKKDCVVEAKQQQNTNLVSFDSDFAKLEWKVEITLSTIKMKKVVRPLILLIFHTKSGQKKAMYLDVVQFQELRKNLALTMKHFHLIESLPS